MTLASRSWSALGTSVHLLVTDRRALDPAVRLLCAQLAELDRTCSRFREDSELVRLHAGGQRVSTVLAATVEAALAAASATGGLVDPTLGRSLDALGYDRTFAELPGDGPAGVAVPGRWQEVSCTGGRLELPDGVRLDLGATAKAWAADRAATAIAEAFGTSVLVNLGGDLAVAGPSIDWPVDAAGDVVLVASGGLATSSTRRRTWVRGGHELHHVLDPRTGRPARTPWATVTVAAPTCLAANTASTAALVLAEQAPAWLAARGLAARLVGLDGQAVHVGGWPQPETAA